MAEQPVTERTEDDAPYNLEGGIMAELPVTERTEVVAPFDLEGGTMVEHPVKERTVEVVAPSNLEGGYEFVVDVDGASHKVRVPEGGVVAGQRFDAIIVSDASDVHKIPHGRWRDGLCDCFAFGCFHPVCCLAFWCNPCAVGQVLDRMELNWLGNALTDDDYSPFRVLFAYVIIFQAVNVIIELATTGPQKMMENPIHEIWLLNVGLLLFVVFLTTRLRGHVRRLYLIPGNCWSDFCCAVWCGPCTTCQISRHTADFRNHPATCCTNNGLPDEEEDTV